ncbi:DNA N-6-adenine-methyltransferase [Glaesserella parasuis]|uniref:DNA N-6-adenine-methyltransferase n=1 Tax=Glaesserella parasuis TaxID=738 RepID=A0AAJ6AH78_GLAPU|nr:DNA N-6-adenine-methyltransferase [Glaesserella parasuis]WGE08994.1 DNA N-6-adenine-methyltransferase [Glaesserella parasuis]
MSFDKDTWRTPAYFAKWVQMRWHCTIDGTAFLSNKVCGHWIGKLLDGEESFSHVADDFLAEDLPEFLSNWGSGSHSIFVNPPYSDVTPFIKQAKRLRDAGHTVVMLLNNDKSTQWYQNHIHNVANEVIDIIGGRIAFVHPITGEEIKGNSKGQMVVVFDPTMEDFVQRSMSLDFIKKVGGYEKG